jgi:hypothetical protein
MSIRKGYGFRTNLEEDVMKKALVTIVAAVLTAPLLASPLQEAQDVDAFEMCPDVVTGLLVEAKKSIPIADMGTFKKSLDEGNYDLVVDVREPPEYDKGHIPGAINIPRGVIEFMIWKAVGFPDATDKEKNIYLYCNTGGRASLSGKSLNSGRLD